LLSVAPGEVRVDFSEPISDEFIDVAVVTATETIVGQLTGRRDSNDATALIITLPALNDGSYQIGFSVRDEIDLHEVRGRTTFTIGDHAVARASPPLAPGAQPFELPARWAFAIGVALLSGALALRARWPEVPIAAPHRLTWCTTSGAALVLAGRLGVIAARAADLDVGWVAALSAVARTEDVTRLPVYVAALACLVPTLLPRRWPWLDTPLRGGWSTSCRLVIGWVGVVWLALLAGWGDHAALGGSVEPGIALAKAAHVIGLGLWVGVLVVTVVVSAGSGRTRATLAASSGVAVLGALVTVASGLVLAGRTVVSLTGAFATPFGRLLVVKVGFLGVAVALGLVQRRSGRVSRATAEAVVLGVVVALGAAMATAGPATDDAYLTAPVEAAPPTITSQIDDVIVRLRAVPGRPGTNDLELTVAQTRRPAVALDEVRIDLDTPAGPRRWTVVPDARGAAVVPAVELPEGSSELAMTIVRTGFPDTDGTTSISTTAVEYHHPPIVSSRPIVGVLHAAALGIALVTFLAVLATAHRRRLGDDRAGPTLSTAVGAARTTGQ
jgi:copper transport protein